MMHESMYIKHQWNYTDRVKTELVVAETLSQSHFNYYEAQIDLLKIKNLSYGVPGR
jgi:hypothetical protein